jgi:hypothetical protein
MLPSPTISPSANITIVRLRNAAWKSALLCLIALMLLVRTVAYNYDFALSLKDNARNYNPFHKPIHSQPITTKKPRAMSSITLPMAQSQADICQNTPLVKTFSSLHDVTIQAGSAPSHSLNEQSAYLLLSQAEPPNLCVLHATFRI